MPHIHLVSVGHANLTLSSSNHDAVAPEASIYQTSNAPEHMQCWDGGHHQCAANSTSYSERRQLKLVIDGQVTIAIAELFTVAQPFLLSKMYFFSTSCMNTACINFVKS